MDLCFASHNTSSSLGFVIPIAVPLLYIKMLGNGHRTVVDYGGKNQVPSNLDVYFRRADSFQSN